ncbi:hypothetical protein EIK77_004269 [Talaromyces pinophilus]|nr:hypothetical protein EIK77_004269 [Talaromyces pinophilus]
MFPKMLSFTPVLQESYTMTLARRSFLPMIVTRGSDQSQISSSFQTRNDPSNLRNFGSLLLDFAKIVPDGIVVFFPSYLYMESTLHVWSGMGILDMIWNYKLILVETPDAQESSLALETYRTASMRHASQCLGRVIRGKDDYGIMVLADKRFARKRSQLPKWINQTILESEVNLSTDMAVATAKNFLRTMAQPFKAKDHEGISSWTPAQLEEQIAKRKIEEDRIERGEEPLAAPQRNGGNGAVGSAQADKDEFDDDIDDELMMLDA